MSEFPKFIPGEETIGSIEIVEMDLNTDYFIDNQSPRDRIIKRTPAPEYEAVEIIFTNPKESGIADVRDILFWNSGLTEHDLAAILYKNGVIPFVSYNIQAPEPPKNPNPQPKDLIQPDPTDPRTHLSDYKKEINSKTR